MYRDVSLPGDEAWVALTEDLRLAKGARNALRQENTYVCLRSSLLLWLTRLPTQRAKSTTHGGGVRKGRVSSLSLCHSRNYCAYIYPGGVLF